MARSELTPYKKITLPEKIQKEANITNLFASFTVDVFILSILGFLLGRVVLFNELSPLAIAYYGAFHKSKVNRIWIMSSVFLGMVTIGNDVSLAKYGVILILMACLQSYRDAKGKEAKLVGQAFISSVSVLVIGVVVAILEGVSTYYMVVAALESILVFAMVYIYGKSIDIFTGNLRRKVLSNEEIISMTILLGSVIAGLGNLNLYDIYLKEILSFFIILMFAYRGGAAVGASIGIVIGIILTITGHTEPIVAGIFGASGMIAGLFRDLGRLGSILGFVLGSCILTFYFSINLFGIQYFAPMGIAVMIFMLLPKSVVNKMSMMISYERSLEQDLYMSRVREITKEKLHAFAASFLKLGDTFSNLSEKKQGLTQQEVSRLFDDIASGVCSECGMCTHCWENDFYNTYQTVFSILAAAEKKGKITMNDIPQDFMNRCLKVEEFVSNTNRMFDLYKLNLTWHNRIVESRELVSQQLKGVSSIVERLANDIYVEMNFNSELEEIIKVELDQERIYVKDIVVLENKYDKYEVNITLKPCHGKRDCIRRVTPAVNKALGRKMKQTHNGCTTLKNQGFCTIRFIEEEQYRISKGIAKAIKENNDISGDNYSVMELKGGQCLLALSDGMGSGAKANEESAAAIELLEQFMESGFDKDIAIKMINSVLVLKSTEDLFSTLDMSIINLYTGICEFVKIGAASTFIIRDGQVEVINSTSLPVGILNKVDIETTKRRLEEGDMIVMVSDGILDSKEGLVDKEKWIEQALTEFSSSNPQDIADYLLEEAKENANHKIKDDMTAVVARIWKR